MCAYIGMKKHNTLRSRYRVQKKNVEEMKDVEQEFAYMLTESWEEIYQKPAMQAQAMHTAKKLRELRALLVSMGQVPQSIN